MSDNLKIAFFNKPFLKGNISEIIKIISNKFIFLILFYSNILIKSIKTSIVFYTTI